MKYILLLILGFNLNSFAQKSESSSYDMPNLEGRYFGTVDYDGQKRRVGVLLKALEGEKDSYHGIVMEYLSPFKEKNFIADFLRPGKRKFFRRQKNGYLKELFQWVKIYKFERVYNSRTFKMIPLVVEGEEIVERESNVFASLQVNMNEKKPMKNAVLKTAVNGRIVDLVMNKSSKRPVSSTWRYNYIPGPYNPGYKQADIDILFLLDDFNEKTREATAIFDVDSLKDKDVFIKGRYNVSEASPGLFIFKDNHDVKSIGSDLVEDKIGVFVDVYDASPIMNTVELILIDPSDPEGSQMYFEEFGNEDK